MFKKLWLIVLVFVMLFTFSSATSQTNLPPSGLTVGWATVPGNNRTEVILGAVTLINNNISSGLHVYADLELCISVMNERGICVWQKNYPPCPTPFYGDPRQAAQDWMIYDQVYAEGVFQQYLDNVWIEPLYNCNMGTTVAEYQWWNEFLDEYITATAARNWPRLQLPTLTYGEGNYVMFKELKPALLNLAQHGGVLSMHIYNPNNTSLCTFNRRYTDRVYTNYIYLQSLGIDLDISVTEFAPGIGNEPVNESEYICWVNRINSFYPFVTQMYMWVHGPHVNGPNSNLEGHVNSLAIQLINILQ